MTKVSSLNLLDDTMVQARKAADWLQKSIQKCSSIRFDKKLSEASFDALENLTSRFARHSDILIQKVFRLIDQIELEPAGSLIDTIHRAAKRGLVSDERALLKARELRNAIAHEYTEEELIALFQEVQKMAPILLEVQSQTEQYCKRLKSS